MENKPQPDAGEPLAGNAQDTDQIVHILESQTQTDWGLVFDKISLQSVFDVSPVRVQQRALVFRPNTEKAEQKHIHKTG